MEESNSGLKTGDMKLGGRLEKIYIDIYIRNMIISDIS